MVEDVSNKMPDELCTIDDGDRKKRSSWFFKKFSSIWEVKNVWDKGDVRGSLKIVANGVNKSKKLTAEQEQEEEQLKIILKKEFYGLVKQELSSVYKKNIVNKVDTLPDELEKQLQDDGYEFSSSAVNSVIYRMSNGKYLVCRCGDPENPLTSLEYLTYDLEDLKKKADDFSKNLYAALTKLNDVKNLKKVPVAIQAEIEGVLLKENIRRFNENKGKKNLVNSRDDKTPCCDKYNYYSFKVGTDKISLVFEALDERTNSEKNKLDDKVEKIVVVFGGNATDTGMVRKFIGEPLQKYANLNGKNRRVIMPQIPNVVKSFTMDPADLTPKQVAEMCAKALYIYCTDNNIPPENVDFYGFSLGGTIAALTREEFIKLFESLGNKQDVQDGKEININDGDKKITDVNKKEENEKKMVDQKNETGNMEEKIITDKNKENKENNIIVEKKEDEKEEQQSKEKEKIEPIDTVTNKYIVFAKKHAANVKKNVGIIHDKSFGNLSGILPGVVSGPIMLLVGSFLKTFGIDKMDDKMNKVSTSNRKHFVAKEDQKNNGQKGDIFSDEVLRLSLYHFSWRQKQKEFRKTIKTFAFAALIEITKQDGKVKATDTAAKIFDKNTFDDAWFKQAAQNEIYEENRKRNFFTKTWFSLSHLFESKKSREKREDEILNEKKEELKAGQKFTEKLYTKYFGENSLSQHTVQNFFSNLNTAYNLQWRYIKTSKTQTKEPHGHVPITSPDIGLPQRILNNPNKFSGNLLKRLGSEPKNKIKKGVGLRKNAVSNNSNENISEGLADSLLAYSPKLVLLYGGQQPSQLTQIEDNTYYISQTFEQREIWNRITLSWKHNGVLQHRVLQLGGVGMPDSAKLIFQCYDAKMDLSCNKLEKNINFDKSDTGIVKIFTAIRAIIYAPMSQELNFALRHQEVPQRLQSPSSSNQPMPQNNYEEQEKQKAKNKLCALEITLFILQEHIEKVVKASVVKDDLMGQYKNLKEEVGDIFENVRGLRYCGFKEKYTKNLLQCINEENWSQNVAECRKAITNFNDPSSKKIEKGTALIDFSSNAAKIFTSLKKALLLDSNIPNMCYNLNKYVKNYEEKNKEEKNSEKNEEKSEGKEKISGLQKDVDEEELVKLFKNMIKNLSDVEKNIVPFVKNLVALREHNNHGMSLAFYNVLPDKGFDPKNWLQLSWNEIDRGLKEFIGNAMKKNEVEVEKNIINTQYK